MIVEHQGRLFAIRKFMKSITLKKVCGFINFLFQTSFCLCSWRKATFCRKSRFSSNTQLGMLLVIKFQSEWWWYAFDFFYKSTICGFTRRRGKFFGSDVDCLMGSRLYLGLSCSNFWQGILLESRKIGIIVKWF